MNHVVAEYNLLHHCCKSKPVKLEDAQIENDERIMHDCLCLAHGHGKAVTKSTDIPVAAIITHAELGVIAKATNTTIQNTDPTAHAEIAAIRQASRLLGNHRLSLCTLYVSLEPCMMCFGACMEARLQRIVFAAHDLKVGMLSKGVYKNTHSLGNHHFTWTGGVLREQASHHLKQFFRKHCRA